ncbi:GDP-mannose 4,6-dehydratase [Paenibacillus sp. IB182496]|uniref:GDP-mannose 4,6-dehydratase n=1 Tax=Paenibacillus sabuli TaxID=2772509 RepID=A0A927BVJ3_9BACL|nr:GDP-mannose 4,6-dehydratase [Paenibacillus sabuli]MBD2847132.1 GDP-mannose 4,6-dehydratase [Paenibacillus sabuli]
MRVLVTGADGFVGRILVRQLAARGYEAVAATRGGTPQPDAAASVALELGDPQGIEAALREARPDAVAHLAAFSRVGDSWRAPAETMTVNAVGTAHLLEAIARVDRGIKLLSVGSGDEYGAAGQTGNRLTEEHPCLPRNPYATSKLAAGQLALQLGARAGICVVHARAFNHFGPGQREGFAISDFASRIARIEAGLLPPVLEVGNLEARRDFLPATAVAQAYVALLEQEVGSGVFNVCSGRARRIRDMLGELLDVAARPIEVRIDPARLRPLDLPVYVGAPDKLTHLTGWTPPEGLGAHVLETLQWWRDRMTRSRAGGEPSWEGGERGRRRWE